MVSGLFGVGYSKLKGTVNTAIGVTAYRHINGYGPQCPTRWVLAFSCGLKSWHLWFHSTWCFQPLQPIVRPNIRIIGQGDCSDYSLCQLVVLCVGHVCGYPILIQNHWIQNGSRMSTVGDHGVCFQDLETAAKVFQMGLWPQLKECRFTSIHMDLDLCQNSRCLRHWIHLDERWSQVRPNVRCLGWSSMNPSALMLGLGETLDTLGSSLIPQKIPRPSSSTFVESFGLLWCTISYGFCRGATWACHRHLVQIALHRDLAQQLRQRTCPGDLAHDLLQRSSQRVLAESYLVSLLFTTRVALVLACSHWCF